MNKEDFNSDTLSKNLAERVKELECLYNISRIASIHKNNLSQALELIVKEIPKGWQYPNSVAVYLQLGEKKFGIPLNNEKSQSVKLQFGNEIKGELFVYFKQPNNLKINEEFLKEEHALLEQIGYEISSLVELDLKRQSELLIQEKLRFSDRLNLLGELTAGIAHELNTPLGNILGYTELLHKDEKDSYRKNDLQKVIKSAKHAREIVKKLMFFSCEMPSQFKKTNLNELVSECLDLLRIQLNDKSIKVDTELSNNVPLLNLDSVQFTQVIFNIVLNAIDAMETNGELKIATWVENQEVKLSIQDSGRGIPNDEIKKLFQPFYTNNSDNGTGLGLAVSHGIVQAHKGRIDVESTVGKGTIFTIVLLIA